MQENHHSRLTVDQAGPASAEIPQSAASYGNVPHDAAAFRKVPQPTAGYGNVRQGAERTENHTVTVHEAARLFEAAGVARIERSIVNWCQPNKQGVARLDCYLDPNDRKYYITSQSIERAIAEEKDKLARHVEPLPHDAAEAEESANLSDNPQRQPFSDDVAGEHVQELERRLRDSEINNRVKDRWIERLEKERDDFALERQSYVEKLMTFNHKVGELETQLRQLAAPRDKPDGQPE